MIDKVIWPARYDPKHTAIYALNDIDLARAAEAEVARQAA
ncbi:hypothetical protein OKW42_000271 [Paraburkholderia sp. WC7.3d]